PALRYEVYCAVAGNHHGLHVVRTIFVSELQPLGGYRSRLRRHRRLAHPVDRTRRTQLQVVTHVADVETHLCAARTGGNGLPVFVTRITQHEPAQVSAGRVYCVELGLVTGILERPENAGPPRTRRHTGTLRESLAFDCAHSSELGATPVEIGGGLRVRAACTQQQRRSHQCSLPHEHLQLATAEAGHSRSTHLA